MNSNISRAYALAPQNVVNHRSRRYSGDTVCSSMEDFVSSDQQIIERVYQFLIALFERLSAPPTTDLAGPLKEVLRNFQFYALVDEMRQLGAASHQVQPSDGLAKTIHDLRGGALTSLVGHLDAVIDLNDEATAPAPLFALVRDHLKIMRNSLSDLDYPRRQHDLLPRAHSIRVMIDKWRDLQYGPADRLVRVRVICTHEEGTLSECCVESAAIDRILYNLMNNAVRHAVAPEVELCVIAVPEGGSPQSLRFVVTNTVSDEDRAFLQELRGDGQDLQALYERGVSSNGSGLGLTIAAEFVACAYGLLDPQEAATEHYVGATLQDDQFVTWFHWPLSSWQPSPSMELRIQEEETV